MTTPFKVGDTVVFSDYDDLKTWFMATIPQDTFHAQPNDVMTIEAKWDDNLFVQTLGWSGALPVRFFKHAEGE